ncbi:lipopolysaccharide biosynthesis protein [Methylosinus sp. Sm6]|uniref:lipopolysaccharide biosynthesis protein n=1 Tax=Methylosinus sp. Sm6 TaxID=2866948 RepID=UPI001C99BA39|nr:polysaccharide biosynthesis C-terminal domain-containing protein [Methylosinus sp. Sm6]MBY6241982.1 polysaccharide biosynthesis C-terminal domain-containing protein [Methylosinus sp. Sm6]
MSLNKFTRNTMFGLLASLNSSLGSFLGLVIVGRILGPVGAGTVAIGVWVTGMAVTFADLGLPLTIARFTPELMARGELAYVDEIGPYFFRPILFSTALVVGLFAELALGGAQWIRDSFRLRMFSESPDSIWLVIAFVFAVQALNNFGLSVLRGRQSFDVAAKLTAIGLPLQLVATAAGCFYGGAEGALIGYAMGSVVCAAAALQYMRATTGLPEDLRRRAWRFAVNNWGVGLISVIVWSRIEIGFLDYWRGAKEAGLFAVSYTLCNLAAQAPLLMTGGILPLFAERHALGDRSGLHDAYASSIRFVAVVLFPACFGMAAIAPLFLPVLFGPEFAEASASATILIAMQAFGSISTVSTTLLLACEKSSFLVRTGALGVVLSLLAGVTVIPAFGVMGAVSARSAVQGFLTLASFVYIAKVMEAPFPLAKFCKIVLAATGCALAARAIVTQWQAPAALALAIACGAAVYGWLIVALGALEEKELQISRTLMAEILLRGALRKPS